METAPLTLAHAHARKASRETGKSKLTIAAAEHESAAGEFAQAAASTGDVEALRILKLLEEHHHKLADIIKTRDVIAKQLTANDDDDDNDDDATSPTHHRRLHPQIQIQVHDQDDQPTSPTTSTPHAPDTVQPQQTPRNSALTKAQQHQHQHQHQHQRRDSSPALAKDIASRRGIPPPLQRTLHPSTAEAKTRAPPSETASGRRSSGSKRSRHHEVVEVPSASTALLNPPKTSPAEDGFARFYSNLTSGPFSKISSMLAFAALPLTEPASQPSSPTSSRSEKTSVRAHNEADIKSLISPAALHALEEQSRRQGLGGQVFGPGESFYVVPPSGGTASYANIISREQRYAARRHHHLSDINEEDAEFVDARENQPLRTSATGGPSGRALSSAQPAASSHRVEELELENDTLKNVLDQMSHRLQAFERSAQDASMAALAQSMASVRTTGAGAAHPGPSLHPDPADRERERLMEEELQLAVKEIQKLRSQNGKYKNYLEKLKDSARQKEKERRERGEGLA